MLLFTHKYRNLSTNEKYDTYQSGLTANQNTETAHKRVYNHLQINSDSNRISILILQNLTAAFDTMDHNVFIQRLQCSWLGQLIP